MSDEKKLELYQANPERYTIGSNGSVHDRGTGRIVGMIASMNPYAITRENARAMLERKRQIVQLATLRGLARKAGIDVDDATLEEIAKGAGTALEAMTGHTYKTFMESNNLRGQGETLRAILALLGVEKDEKEVRHVHEFDPGESLMKLVDLMREATKPSDAINGDVIE